MLPNISVIMSAFYLARHATFESIRYAMYKKSIDISLGCPFFLAQPELQDFQLYFTDHFKLVVIFSVLFLKKNFFSPNFLN